MFYKAIMDTNSKNLQIVLSNGTVMNNCNDKKNTINCAIKAMLNNHPVDEFNLNFINDLINCGAKIML